MAIFGEVKYADYQRELRRAERMLKEDTLVKDINHQIWFVNDGTDREIRLGLNITATGNITPKTAKGFAYCIEVAAKIAEDFKYNGYSIDYKED